MVDYGLTMVDHKVEPYQKNHGTFVVGSLPDISISDAEQQKLIFYFNTETSHL